MNVLCVETKMRENEGGCPTRIHLRLRKVMGQLEHVYYNAVLT